MAVARTLLSSLLALVLLTSPAHSAAERKEPLIVTTMRDPDPFFVSSASDAGGRGREADLDDNRRVERAIETFGRAVGEAAMLEQQQIEAKCREGVYPSATPEQRFAWAATCRYSRR